MKVGYVDFWHRDRGFGWLMSENLKYFAHISNFISLQPGTAPQAGQQVEFEEGRNSKGLVAISVRIVTQEAGVKAGA